MRYSLYYFIPTGLFLGFIGFMITLLALGLRAVFKARRVNRASRWALLPILIGAPGEVFEFIGLVFILMAVLNTLTLRLQIIIESQFLLTLYLVFLPVLVSAGVVRGFNHLLNKWIIRNPPVQKEAEPKNIVNNVTERIRKV